MYYERKVSATMRERKKLSFSLELKSLDEQGRFAGYASVFDVVDNQRDLMLRGAFSKTIEGRSGNIKMLWQHQQSEPIGVFDRLFEDAHGLYVEGRLLLDVQRAREAYSLLKSGAVSGLSIGYSPVRYRIAPETGVRLLAQVELWEISLVTFPANEAAGVTVVKHSKGSSVCRDASWPQAHSSGEVLRLAEALDRAICALQY